MLEAKEMDSEDLIAVCIRFSKSILTRFRTKSSKLLKKVPWNKVTCLHIDKEKGEQMLKIQSEGSYQW